MSTALPALPAPTTQPSKAAWSIHDHLPDVKQIFALHHYKRPDWSYSEHAFIRMFILPLGVKRDGYHNYYKIVGPAKPRIMWSAHTDTVHSNAGTQKLALFGGKKLKLARNEKGSNCLGADDGAGVWMLIEMIKANMPGLYIFHRNEEKGCQGARHFLRHNADLLVGIEAAITFDRKGKTDIITHQCGRRTCSDAFANSLAQALDLQHLPDDGGLFTDTEVYKEVIPECTNVAAGYKDAHGGNESLDLPYLIGLRDAVLKMDLDSLVIERDPKKIEYKTYHWRGRQANDGWEGDYGGSVGKKFDSYTPAKIPVTILDFVKQHPDEVADFLETLGVNAADLRDYVQASKNGFASATDALPPETSGA